MSNIDLSQCITVAQLKYVAHCATPIEYADFFTCEEVSEPDEARKVVNVSISDEKLFVFIA